MPSVLVTGASRGIGRAITEHLAARGWDVIAGVRSQTDADAVTAVNPQRISAVILDVTDAEHIDALATSLPARLDAVVNNAGIVVAGAVETIPIADWRKQLEVNVIGQVAVTQEVLPRLRESRGRIVFISSVNGRMSMPLMGAYSASKFALEAAADALRVELTPWDIPVVVVEPAQTDTDMWRTADIMVSETEANLTAEHRDLYAKHIAGMKKIIPIAQRTAAPSAKVTAVVEQALTARRPRPRYVVGLGPKIQVGLMGRLPTGFRDRVQRRMFGLP
ncbi:SDR family oxidoreductase [Mycolicibacterium sp. XJ879]